MSIIDTLITDRTESDVNYAAQLAQKGWAAMTVNEKAAWIAGLKGSYNATDLNRVGAAVAYVAAELSDIGYSVSVNPKTDWAETDIPTIAQMQTYLDDIDAIRSALSAPSGIPSVPDSMALLNYTKANHIERILVEIDQLVQNIIASFVPCGLPYCGQIWQEYMITDASLVGTALVGSAILI